MAHSSTDVEISKKVEICMPDIKIVKDYVPGALGRVAELHGVYYHDHWKFGLFFEAKVAVELSEFLKRYDEIRDGFWPVLVDGRVEGSITIDGIDGENEGAHLRWFIISDVLRGKGAGNRLINTAISFCKSRHYNKIFLWTFEGLIPARHLYENGTQWGTRVNEQRFECFLTGIA
jgi:GNAT superfamily N-acetyltransferase